MAMNADNRTRQAYDRATKITSQVLDDFRNSELPQTLRRDFKETYVFYLDEETRTELASMGRTRRSLYSTWYLLKSLFFKLSPTRRLLLLMGVFVTVSGTPDETGQIIAGLLGILFVLGLELKDKLLAKDELEEGRAIQIALMPSASPVISGWDAWMYSVPANDVGGDLVDHMRIDENTVSLTLGDVAGKGLSAALMMAKLQATIRALAPISGSLVALAEQLNAIVCRDGLPSKFASLVHVSVHENSGEVEVLNAGHLPPLIVRPDRIDEIRRGSPAIGLSRNSKFSVTDVLINPGDLMIICSDGVTESRNEAGGFFGEKRLADLARLLRDLSALDAGTALLSAVRDFEDGAARHDDLSIVLLKRLHVLPQRNAG
jgi:phosphoserine phosphatase RsbU/P